MKKTHGQMLLDVVCYVVLFFAAASIISYVVFQLQ